MNSSSGVDGGSNNAERPARGDNSSGSKGSSGVSSTSPSPPPSCFFGQGQPHGKLASAPVLTSAFAKTALLPESAAARAEATGPMGLPLPPSSAFYQPYQQREQQQQQEGNCQNAETKTSTPPSLPPPPAIPHGQSAFQRYLLKKEEKPTIFSRPTKQTVSVTLKRASPGEKWPFLVYRNRFPVVVGLVCVPESGKASQLPPSQPQQQQQQQQQQTTEETASGLLKNDVIVKINGIPPNSHEQAVKLFADAGLCMTLEVQREQKAPVFSPFAQAASQSSSASATKQAVNDAQPPSSAAVSKLGLPMPPHSRFPQAFPIVRAEEEKGDEKNKATVGETSQATPDEVPSGTAAQAERSAREDEGAGGGTKDKGKENEHDDDGNAHEVKRNRKRSRSQDSTTTTTTTTHSSRSSSRSGSNSESDEDSNNDSSGGNNSGGSGEAQDGEGGSDNAEEDGEEDGSRNGGAKEGENASSEEDHRADNAGSGNNDNEERRSDGEDEGDDESAENAASTPPPTVHIPPPPTPQVPGSSPFRAQPASLHTGPHSNSNDNHFREDGQGVQATGAAAPNGSARRLQDTMRVVVAVAGSRSLEVQEAATGQNGVFETLLFSSHAYGTAPPASTAAAPSSAKKKPLSLLERDVFKSDVETKKGLQDALNVLPNAPRHAVYDRANCPFSSSSSHDESRGAGGSDDTVERKTGINEYFHNCVQKLLTSQALAAGRSPTTDNGGKDDEEGAHEKKKVNVALDALLNGKTDLVLLAKSTMRLMQQASSSITSDSEKLNAEEPSESDAVAQEADDEKRQDSRSSVKAKVERLRNDEELQKLRAALHAKRAQFDVANTAFFRVMEKQQETRKDRREKAAEALRKCESGAQSFRDELSRTVRDYEAGLRGGSGGNARSTGKGKRKRGESILDVVASRRR